MNRFFFSAIPEIRLGIHENLGIHGIQAGGAQTLSATRAEILCHDILS